MTNDEKRTLEIFITLLIQHIRKNNTKALEHLRALFFSMSFEQTYDPDFLYKVCVDNIEILEQIPTHMEIVLTTQIESDILKVTKTSYKPIYRPPITSFQSRQAQFTETRLQPKIKIPHFHKYLLTFFKTFGIIGSAVPQITKRNIII